MVAGTNRGSITSKNDFMQIINSCKQDLFDLRELEDQQETEKANIKANLPEDSPNTSQL